MTMIISTCSSMVQVYVRHRVVITVVAQFLAIFHFFSPFISFGLSGVGHQRSASMRILGRKMKRRKRHFNRTQTSTLMCVSED